ncbi:hypothetical protein [Paenibacillus plantiphilus]|nr:hypothetical protein [Paenibacillus plantiphilus]
MAFEEQPPKWLAPGVEPPESKKSEGWLPNERPPADYWNWQMNQVYLTLLELQQKAAEGTELTALESALLAHINASDNPHDVTAAQIGAETPAGAQTKVDMHAIATSVHGATSAATANRIPIRDNNSRFKVGAPVAADDVARKDTVDNAVTYGVLRNSIINGGFDISQRIGVLGSLTLPATGGSGNNYGYALDRWWTQAFTNTTSSASVTVSQQAFSLGQTIVPNYPKYHCRIAINSLPALGASSAVIRHIQRIEGVHLFSGKSATLSFWAKASTNRSIAVTAGQDFGIEGSAGVTVGQVINLTTSWQLFSLTFSFPSISGKTVGEHNHLAIKIIPYKQDDLAGETIPSGQVGSWTTGNIDIAQVVLNEGAAALPFQPKSFAEELALCQRYYEKSYNYGVVPGWSTNMGREGSRVQGAGNYTMESTIHFKVPKRVSPTVGVYSTTGEWGFWRLGGSTNIAQSATNVSETGFLSFSTREWALNDIYEYQWTADAEL